MPPPACHKRQAQAAEKGLFDYLFIADSVRSMPAPARIISTASSRSPCFPRWRR
jgi:alkanesulfonate monooxygenase SsuD/methylene tetrahydromethanopterin reductase-like flavin-dependent oxidoreductase (luciferase family)